MGIFYYKGYLKLFKIFIKLGFGNLNIFRVYEVGFKIDNKKKLRIIFVIDFRVESIIL